MKYENILIASTTRTGSTYLTNFLHNNLKAFLIQNSGKDNNIDPKNITLSTKKHNILHFHDSHFDLAELPNTNQWHLILSTRNNKFDQVCSYCLAHHTGQWQTYNYYNFKVKLSMRDFIIEYEKILEIENRWKQLANQSKFKSFTEITYESLLTTNLLNTLTNTLNVQLAETNCVTEYSQKSPYIKQKVISNYNEIKKKFEDYLNSKNR